MRLTSKIAFLLFGFSILASSVSIVSACSIKRFNVPPIEYIEATKWLVFDGSFDKYEYTNLNKYTIVWTISKYCDPTWVYIKSWILYTIVLVIALIVLIVTIIILKRFRNRRLLTNK